MEIKVQLAEGVDIPAYRTELGASFDIKVHSFKKLYKGKKEIDLRTQLQESIKRGYIMLRPFERLLIGTGISMVLPTGIELQIRTKPSVSLSEGLVVVNSPTGVEPSFTKEICILLHNSCQFLSKVKLGDEVAQGVFSEFKVVTFQKD